jgi:hypothetical protein
MVLMLALLAVIGCTTNSRTEEPHLEKINALMQQGKQVGYPRLKSAVSAADLVAIYTPTQEDLAPAKQITRGKLASLGFLILLKTFGCSSFRPT